MLTYFESKGIEKALAFNISEAVRKGRGVSAENQQKLLTAGVPD
jgi:DNA polymerase III alpha subunit (gram-positive type)